VREVQLDQRREQHVGGCHPGECEDRQGEEHERVAGDRAAAETTHDRQQRHQRHPVDADPAGERRCHRPEEAEGHHRQRGQDAGLDGPHPERGRDLGKHRADADRRRPEVEAEDQHPGQHEGAAQPGLLTELGRWRLEHRHILPQPRWSPTVR
jgi:hypothetical protein